ncbi:14796_t:CDS:1, partial [Dentiscutata heterogama]
LNKYKTFDGYCYQDEIDNPDPFITSSSISKGNDLESIALRILKNMKIDCQ